MTPVLVCLATVWGGKATGVVRQEFLCHLTVSPFHLFCPPQHPQPWSIVQTGKWNASSYRSWIPVSVYCGLLCSIKFPNAVWPGGKPQDRACAAKTHQHLLSAHNKASDAAVNSHSAEHSHTSVWSSCLSNKQKSSRVLFEEFVNV